MCIRDRGSFTFILPATREVPRRLQHPKRSTIGLRIPDHPVALALLEALGEPLISATLMLHDEPFPLRPQPFFRASSWSQAFGAPDTSFHFVITAFDFFSISAACRSSSTNATMRQMHDSPSTRRHGKAPMTAR